MNSELWSTSDTYLTCVAACAPDCASCSAENQCTTCREGFVRVAGSILADDYCKRKCPSPAAMHVSRLYTLSW